MKNAFTCTVTSLRGWPLLFLLLLLLPCFGAFAQNSYIISGTVSDQSTSEALVGSTVQIEGTSLGTVTDVNGKYRLSASVEPGDYVLVIRSIGYMPQKENISLGGQQNVTVDASLKSDVLNLDEVVVTGNSVATSRKQLGNAISTIQTKDLDNSGAVAVDQALSGKISGALVQQNSGDPAGGISIRLRGPSTISGSSDPLYIVDGVIINNSSNQLIDLGGGSQNRLVDINPNDIDHIEVIKGAAAAAIYGSRASNGVVQIFTKKGQSGRPTVTFQTNFKVNTLRKKVDYNEVPLVWDNPSDYSDLSTSPATRYDIQDDIFRTGIGTENFVSVKGGNDNTKYFVSGSYLNNQGIVKNTDFERYGLRLNLNQTVSDWLSINTNVNYTQSLSQDVPNGGLVAYYGALTGFLFADNSIDPTPSSLGVYPQNSLFSNPAEVVSRYEFGQKTNRVISGVGIVATPVKNLSINYQLGLDYYNQSATGYLPIGNTYSPYPNGYATRGDANVFQFNNDLNFSYEAELSPSINSTTVVGGTWQYQSYQGLTLSARDLVPGAKVSSAGTIIGQSDQRSEISFWGAFAQETLSFKDKLFITGALRLDGASVFGEDERQQLYGKASASYVISEEDFWQNAAIKNTISNLKLRGSWGQAGNLTAIGAFDRFSNYNPISINSVSGVTPSTLLGNASLAPERQQEIELGADIGLLDDRLGLEVTYYKQNVSDLLLERELAPSSGYSTRYENVGSLTNEGIEVLLRALIVNKEDFSWSLTSTFSSNKNTVTEVVGESITLPGSFSASYVIPGQSLGVFRGRFYARDEAGNILYGDNGLPYSGTDEDGATTRILGDPNPDWFGSLINEFSYQDFNLRVQFDAVQGYDVFNWNKRVLNRFGGGPTYAQELLGERPKGFSTATYSIYEEFIEDGSFVKLREISLSYSLKPDSEVIQNIRFSLVGRNLLSFDNYSGWDPEVNTPGQSNGVRGFDFAAVPIPRTYQLGVNVTF